MSRDSRHRAEGEPLESALDEQGPADCQQVDLKLDLPLFGRLGVARREKVYHQLAPGSAKAGSRPDMSARTRALHVPPGSARARRRPESRRSARQSFGARYRGLRHRGFQGLERFDFAGRGRFRDQTQERKRRHPVVVRAPGRGASLEHRRHAMRWSGQSAFDQILDHVPRKVVAPVLETPLRGGGSPRTRLRALLPGAQACSLSGFSDRWVEPLKRRRRLPDCASSRSNA